jgi:hypothetical protein
VEHRKTRPYTPTTNGPRPAPAGRRCADGSSALRSTAERFNGRIQREVLGITIDSHRDLDGLPRGFNQAYNARQRVLGGISPDEAVRRRLRAEPTRASKLYEPPSDPCVLPKALLIVKAAKEVSHPDN